MTGVPGTRDLTASLLAGAGVTSVLGRVLNSRRLRGELARGVNYHGTRADDRAALARHVDYYTRHFDVFDAARLEVFVAGTGCFDRPGLMITFDDGFKNHYTVAADVLDGAGVKGFFFVPAAFPGLAHDRQHAAAFARAQVFAGQPPGHLSDDDMQPMSWDDARDLVRRGHVIGCHTMTHHALGPDESQETLQREIVEAKAVIEAELKSPVTAFCWAFGSMASYSAAAFDLIRQHYRFGFTTFAAAFRRGQEPLAIDRSNVEASMPFARVLSAVQGVTELHSAARRRRFERLVGLRGV